MGEIARSCPLEFLSCHSSLRFGTLVWIQAPLAYFPSVFSRFEFLHIGPHRAAYGVVDSKRDCSRTQLLIVRYTQLAYTALSVTMPSTCSPSIDDTFGPVVHGCNSNFDFTLLFEQSVLSIGSTGLLLIFVPPRLVKLWRSSEKTVPDALRFRKLVSRRDMSQLYGELISFRL
jgi:hypothetical protein